jgi:hypothetical protein
MVVFLEYDRCAQQRRSREEGIPASWHVRLGMIRWHAYLAVDPVGGDRLRRHPAARVAQDLTQGDVAQRTEGQLGVDDISLMVRGKRLPSPEMCQWFAGALGLSEPDEEHMLLLACIDKAAERLKPLLRQIALVPRLRKLHAFIRDLLDEHANTFIAALEAIADGRTDLHNQATS